MSTILIYDDEVEILSLYERILKKSGHRIECRISASSIDQDLSEINPDLVITDIVMDRIDGFETMARIKRFSPETKILAVSGGGVHLNKDYCLNTAGMLYADRTLSKPIDVDELAEIVGSMLKESENSASGHR